MIWQRLVCAVRGHRVKFSSPVCIRCERRPRGTPGGS